MATNTARKVLVPQSPNDGVDTAFAASVGRSDLSLRELEVLRLSAGGLTANAAAAVLGVTEATVKFHLAGARKKLGVRSTAEAIARLLTSRGP